MLCLLLYWPVILDKPLVNWVQLGTDTAKPVSDSDTYMQYVYYYIYIYVTSCQTIHTTRFMSHVEQHAAQVGSAV